MNWDRHFGDVVTFSTLDAFGKATDTVTLNHGTGVVASNLLAPGGSYGIGHAAADIYAISFSNGAVGIRNLSISSGPAAVTPVPEPATWMLMILGFGAVGLARRRRRTRAVLA